MWKRVGYFPKSKILGIRRQEVAFMVGGEEGSRIGKEIDRQTDRHIHKTQKRKRER